MCFRPSSVSVDSGPNCPECGRALQLPEGVIINKCPFCKYEFTEEDKKGIGKQAPVSAPVASRAPQAPSAPKAPSAPSAPPMPKA